MNRLIIAAIALVFSLLLLTGINAQDGITVTDVNDDGVVDILDLVYVALHFGESSDPTQTPSPDVNGDGVVNILDLVIVANMIGEGRTETMPSDNTLIFGRGGDSITLDPSQVLDGESAKVCDMIFDTLVQYREDTTDIEPALAVAWDSSADGLTWAFHLRQGVQFHDGTPFNANVAAFSITRPNAQTGDLFDQFISQIIALGHSTHHLKAGACASQTTTIPKD